MKFLCIFLQLLLVVCLLEARLQLNINREKEKKKTKAKSPELEQTNLLFLIFDDLRPELSIYGKNYMYTPNFERLARHSVTFDYAFCQVSVCNPSRDSLLTGLRPDSVGTVNFNGNYRPHLVLPQQLVLNNYNTAGVGKMFHWDRNDPQLFTNSFWNNDWYEYQSIEHHFMNASVHPDQNFNLSQFRDTQFVTRGLEMMGELVKSDKPFMMSFGFKLPHIAMHLPYSYYEIYKDPERIKQWQLEDKHLRYPKTSNEIGYRCCAARAFSYMNDEGRLKSNESLPLGKIDNTLTRRMHDELTQGYAGSISFVDDLMGSILDFMDAHDLWKNTTVVLTADHGMHNGEKGIWEKWSLFDESTRVPLLISHPLSPFKGKRYPLPVESIDVYATLNEILKLNKTHSDLAVNQEGLQGKSLAPVIFGSRLYPKLFGKHHLLDNISSFNRVPSHYTLSSFIPQNTVTNLNTLNMKGSKPLALEEDFKFKHNPMPLMTKNFAISQQIRCADKNLVNPYPMSTRQYFSSERDSPWRDCEPLRHTYKREVKTINELIGNPWFDPSNPGKQVMVPEKDRDEYVLMCYSFRTPEYRYNGFFHFDRNTQMPLFHIPPFDEELYDHRGEGLDDFTKLEIENLATRPEYQSVITNLRANLISTLSAIKYNKRGKSQDINYVSV